MTGGGPTYFFGLKIYTLGIFLAQEICHVFLGSYPRASFSIWVSLRSVDRKIFIRTFFQRRVPEKLFILRRQYNVHL